MIEVRYNEFRDGYNFALGLMARESPLRNPTFEYQILHNSLLLCWEVNRRTVVQVRMVPGIERIEYRSDREGD